VLAEESYSWPLLPLRSLDVTGCRGVAGVVEQLSNLQGLTKLVLGPCRLGTAEQLAACLQQLHIQLARPCKGLCAVAEVASKLMLAVDSHPELRVISIKLPLTWDAAAVNQLEERLTQQLHSQVTGWIEVRQNYLTLRQRY
jgi:hypothetical protein